jgi:7-cyano-7-deazaguanine reductase
MKQSQSLKSLGSKTTKYNYEKPESLLLESFENTAGALVVPFVCNEFTSICPVTEQPDYAKLEILYVPDKTCIESKSLKLYLNSFRNHGAFHEDVTNRIMQDIFEKIAPKFIRVFGDFHVRGGISIKPLALKFQENLSSEEKEEIKFKIENYDRLRHWDF